ncbi:unnamed protein product [Pieris macdunnoughi]|uniref:Uncharacterized protein n=1 Tax=Pieris macdunnoughi TaxID=345717 RepID=A0A821RJS9_9NEOP|nr:unnamed protein product [Pieris macdunnoughi]
MNVTIVNANSAIKWYRVHIQRVLTPSIYTLSGSVTIVSSRIQYRHTYREKDRTRMVVVAVVDPRDISPVIVSRVMPFHCTSGRERAASPHTSLLSSVSVDTYTSGTGSKGTPLCAK